MSCTVIMLSEITGNTGIIPMGVVGGQGGITIAFNFFYIIIVEHFTPQYYGLVMGISNFAGKLSTVFAPAIAEIDQPFPMVVAISICAVATFMSTQLEQPVQLKQTVEVAEKKEKTK